MKIHPDLIKLLKNLMLICLMVCVLLAGIVLMGAQNSNTYMASGRDKYHLITTVKSPRIIFVGGSNLAFSIDSEKIEKTFGVPVINMGVHANLGLRFMLKEIEPHIHEGDIILIIPEYQLFYRKTLNGFPETLGPMIKFCPECRNGLTTSRQYFNVVEGVVETAEMDIVGVFNQWAHPDDKRTYGRNGFNDHGDEVAHLDQKNKALIPSKMESLVISKFNPEVLSVLNSFHDHTLRVNARTFLMFPGIPASSYDFQKENFNTYYNVLVDGLNMEILGTPEDFVFPEEYFFDTVYHMNKTGREARTEVIIALLQQVLR